MQKLEYICQCLYDGLRERTHDYLMVKILDKCILSILVYNLF